MFVGEDCDEGYYSVGKETDCIPCPPGYQCADATKEPVVCERGYYSNGTDITCFECDPGFACPEGSKGPRPADGLCRLGFYCENGKDEIDCPAGKLLKV